MTEPEAALARTSPDEAAARLLQWWHGETPGPGSPWTHLVDAGGHGGHRPVLDSVHEAVPDSVMLDVTGLSSEDVIRRVSESAGVDPGSSDRSRWLLDMRRLPARRLVLLANVHRMGGTRRSHEPERLLGGILPALCLPEGLRVVAQLRTAEPLQPSATGFQVVPADRAEPGADVPDALRALALAEPRVVPLPVWVELALALGLEDENETTLNALVERSPQWFAVHEDGVAFADEGLAEAIRERTGPEVLTRFNGRLLDRLRESAPRLRHAEGWPAAGPTGTYAAAGLAMHAVQAGRFEELLADGSLVAYLPQTSLMDAARDAAPGLGAVPGNTAAADAMYLWPYGVIPPRQAEWASWLQLMATARNDHAFAAAIADSGLELPWKARWTKWRPPGGCHVRYLLPGANGLTEVRWQGRPAVAGLNNWTEQTTVRDLATGELLAGPWEGDVPAEHHADLTWPPGSGQDGPGPVTFDDLDDAVPDGADVHYSLLPSPALTAGELVIIGGTGGVFALEPAKGTEFTGLTSPNTAPLSGPYAAVADATTPVDAPPPGPADLAELYGPDAIRVLADDEIPAALTDDAARRTLARFGLPALNDQWGLGISPWGDDGSDVFAEVPWPSDPGIQAPAETGPFLRIGWWMGGALVVDGPTGHVLRIPSEPGEDHLAALPAATGLENFLTMVALWITGLRTKAAIEVRDETHLLTQHVLGALWAADTTGGDAPAWSYAFLND